MPEQADAAADADLVDRIGSDRAALDELYRRHVRSVLGYAARRLDNPADVADVVAGVFLEVMRSAHRYDPARGTPRAWLFGIAANLVAAHGRRAATEARALRRVYGRRELEPDHAAELAERIDAANRAPELRAAMGTLGSSELELFLLVSLDGLSPSEAATVLGISAAAARMRLARARRKLRESLNSPQTARPRPHETVTECR